jgi:hypothetical protein
MHQHPGGEAMSALKRCRCLKPVSLMVAVLLAAGQLGVATAGLVLGPRLGLSNGPDEFFLGGQVEFPRVLGRGSLVPSLDFGLGDAKVTTANLDFRWYLLPLPETGIRFYGSAGPTVSTSPNSELGLSLSVGLDIPMRDPRRYNVECRFGSGDIPDFKIAFAVMFGL